MFFLIQTINFSAVLIGLFISLLFLCVIAYANAKKTLLQKLKLVTLSYGLFVGIFFSVFGNSLNSDIFTSANFLDTSYRQEISSGSKHIFSTIADWILKKSN